MSDTPRTDAEEKGASYFTGVEIRQAWNLARQLEREVAGLISERDYLNVRARKAERALEDARIAQPESGDNCRQCGRVVHTVRWMTPEDYHSTTPQKDEA